MRRAFYGLLAFVLLAPSCASLLDVGTIANVRHVRQRTPYDCTVAVLAMMLQKDYEDVEQERRELGLDISEGLRQFEVIKLAERLGVKLIEKPRPVNFATDTALIAVWTKDKNLAHAVFLKGGQIYDPLLFAGERFFDAEKRWGPFMYALVVEK